ncbi:hypothetical protein VNO77_15276 [Canavalia gladiata]|uniref:F-box protein n=1 Tax=Canavalia gladiata TaxID=3824 RepID=A0AAN9LZG9_CANGL
METPSTPSPPPWEALILIVNYLDPKTLATASCVSKSWYSSMSSDHIWEPILATHFPSLFYLPPSAAAPFRRLFAVGHTAATLRRMKPSKPSLSLSDLVFAISISTRDSPVVSMARPCDALGVDHPGVFRFVVDCDGAVLSEGVEEVKVTWNVVLKGWRGVFTMMECEKKVGFVSGGEGWLSQELPAPGCCANTVASAVVADLKVGMFGGSDGKVRVNKVSVGVLSVMDWRYVGVEDGLRYLQHFLLTCNAL